MNKFDNFDMDAVNSAVLEAVKQFLAEHGLEGRPLHRVTGQTQMTAYRQMNGDSPISLETLCRIKVAFPEFSIDNAIAGNANAVESNNSVGSDNVFNHANVQVHGISNEKFVQEIAEQRKLLATAQAQITSLLGIIEKMQEK